MTTAAVAPALRSSVLQSLMSHPIVGVVRTSSLDEARAEARRLLTGGIQWVEITFSVPGAVELVQELRRERRSDGPPWIGMGTVTTAERAARAVAAGAAFLVSPNVSAAVGRAAREAGIPCLLGALTPTEIVAAHEAGADLVKVYPLPTVGGPRYLETIRGPLGDIPMLAAGGFGADEIPAYRRAGASAFGLASKLLSDIPSALALARG
jgi:2-dehydro-3-deoxyphosphogluconate aldolase/(4S)-4-hydroxy-2-oxoglutarate aldolase